VAIIAIAGLVVGARADNVNGAWSQVYNWPLISVHAALTPDGRVLTYGTNGDGKQTGYFIYDIWDPAFAPDSGHMTLSNMTLTDIFCSSQIILPQTGEILIAGGDNWTGTGTTNTGNNNSNIFDYGDNTLARSANMNRARWYSSATGMLDGSVYIQGGNGGADFPELRRTDGTFQLLTGAGTSAYATLFPRNFLAPDGRVFGYDTNGKMYFVSTANNGSVSPIGQFSSSSAGWTSGAAMFAPGKILQIGASGTVMVDITGPTPVVTQIQGTATPRRWVSATVGPLGNVYATGGSEVENQMTNVAYFTEIWNPQTATWYRINQPAQKARLYHSAALLLPDASILVSGGGAPGPQVNTNAEIYYPPYLFDENGAFAARPSIVSAPNTANAGDNLAVQVDGNISRVTLVKTGSVTHSVNMDQRFIELAFSSSGNMLQVDLPISGGIMPPGYYQMFVVNDEGVPSMGSMLRINIDANPTIAVDYTPTVGGAGGTSFQLACPADEIIVGIHGIQGTYVNRIGPKCVKVDQLGRWIGNPVNGPLTGTSTSGTSFSKLCPVNYAVDGFRANSAQYVNNIDISCRALTPSGGLSGNSQYLGGVGGPGGSDSGQLSCGTGNPVYALYGRSGSWLDSFGVQCRQAQITPISINSEPVVVNPGSLDSTVGEFVDITIQASDGDGDTLTFSATGLPPGLAINTATGRIFGTLTTAGLYDVSVSVSDGTDFDVALFSWDVALALPLTVDLMPPQPAALVNTVVNYTASAHNGINRAYKWDFGDGTAETPYSSSPTISHTFTEPGAFYVTLTVTDDLGIPSVQTFMQAVHLPLTANKPAQSSNIVYETRNGANDRVWLVNQDNDTLSVFDAIANIKLAEISVGHDPRAVAIAPDGRVWVTNKSDASISIVDPAVLLVTQTLALPHDTAPYGIVFSPSSNDAYVVLEATGELLKLDATTGLVTGTVFVGPNPRHVSVESSGVRVFVSRHITPRQPGEGTDAPQSEIAGNPTGGEIVPVDSASMAALPIIVLRHSDKPDFENQGSGVPNYLGALTISPDGASAAIASKQDNIARGSLINGLNLNFQNTVRAISSFVDMATLTEDYARRIDYDNASLASAIAYGPLGIYRFVALETSREVDVVDVHGGFSMFRIPVGRAPQGLVVSPDGNKLFVNNFMDRTLGVYDISELYETGQWNAPVEDTLSSVAVEKLDPQVLLGKQLFYDAADDRLARDDYMSCAVCHNDGGQDGRVWDLTGMGEGLRNTISLRGKAASHGRLHWSQNFDEVQDFEGQIRVLSGGTGLMLTSDFIIGTRSEPLGDPKAGISADLDALAAYVASLDEYPGSPFRNSDGSLTAAGLAGRNIFRREGCASCHSGADFTDSEFNQLHDIGTLKPSSGQRLNGPLTGIDTPTLRGIWGTSPYLHDGSAIDLSDAVAAHSGTSLDAADMVALVAYLQQIDDNEISAPEPNTVPIVDNPGDQSGLTGVAVNLTITASDADGDTLTFSASGLPAGLSIDTIDGEITGMPDTAGVSNVTVTVSDGTASASTSFSWTLVEPNAVPTITNPGDQSGETGTAVSLAIEAMDSDGDTLSYSATGLPADLSISVSTGLISGTPGTPGVSNVTVTVSDGEDNAATSFSWTLVAPNTPPTITNPGDQADKAGTAVSLSIVASDADGDTLNYSAAGLPAGLSINPGSGEISGTPSTIGVSNVTVTVSDGAASASTAFSWEITQNSAPNVTNPGSQTTEVNVAVNLSIVASDADGDTLSYLASGLPLGLSIDSVSGLISGSPTTAGSNDVTVTVGDGSASTETTFSWEITQNSAPSVTNPGSQTTELNNSVSLTIVATDPDIGDTLVFGATGLPSGLAIDAITGEITGVADMIGSHSVTVTVDDGNGGSDSATFDWTVCDPNGGCDTLDFNVYVTESYAGQDKDQSVSVEDGGAAIVLSDNTWRRTLQTFEVTADTVLEFDFESTSEAEIQGIGFDASNRIPTNRVFKLFGTQNVGWDIDDFETYAIGGVMHYRIPVGQYYIGSAMHLVLVNDYDAGTGTNSRFSNVRVYESPP